MSCHGVMGKRQLDLDSATGQADFKLDFVKLTDRSDPHFKYGALARDGISCALCHRIAPDNLSLPDFLAKSTSGAFPASGPDQIFGPYPDETIAAYPMATSLGAVPQYNQYMQSSRMCGTCHTINLPVIDGNSNPLAVHSIEQSTYLEWLNSQYQNEFATPGVAAQSCQQCHMPGSFHSDKYGISVDPIKEKIAIIGDETYPEADNRVPVDEITVPKRDEFKRHELLGLNVFLLEIFNQFSDVLGVRKDDYMSVSNSGLQNAIDNYAAQAQMKTATIAVKAVDVFGPAVRATVTVNNLAGHRFPSGVGFRRAFVELLVIENKDGADNVVWSSGRTNDLGLIVDENGGVLPSEFFSDYTDADGNVRQHYQPHYQTIDAQNQVQIYEELTQNAAGRFTTSFVRRDATVKDNRMLPVGWTQNGPDPLLTGVYLKATQPDGTDGDPDYTDGRAGTDTVAYNFFLPDGVNVNDCRVQATLYYQAIPPYYLNDRFRTAPDGEATRRLYYLTSNLKPQGTVIENWKLKLVSASTPIAGWPRRSGR